MKVDENKIKWNTVPDYLAYQRTKMANSRTLLAFLRTALAIFAAALGMRELWHTTGIRILSIFLYAFSVVLLIYGIWNFFRVKSGISELVNDMEEDSANNRLKPWIRENESRFD